MNINYNEERIDLDSLPAEKEIKGTKTLGCFMVGFATLWGGIPTAVLIGSLFSGKFEPAMLMILIFTVVGAVLFLVGLNQFFIKGTIKIGAEEISYFRKTLFKRAEWTEPVSSYKGVLYRSEYHSGGKNHSSYTLYIVELLHEEKEKTVQLFSSRSDGEVRKYWEDGARMLGKPALEKDGSGFIERDVEDLDKSVKELVQEKKIKVDFDPRSTPPDGLSVEVKDGLMCITLSTSPVPPVAALFMLAFPCVFIYIGFFMKEPPIIFGIIGILFLLIFGGVVVGSHFVRRQLQLSSSYVRSVLLTPWGGKMAVQLSADEIEQVTVKESSQTTRKEVSVKSDTGEITLGQSLKPEAQEWLKNCILAVISA